ncbi:MAG: tetratricopeptide repeat protein [Sarcina sp.]
MNKKIIGIIIAAVVIVGAISGGTAFAISNNSKNVVETQMKMGEQYLEENNYSKALEEYNSVLATNPNNATAKVLSSIIANYNKAQAQYNSGDYNSALATLNGIDAQYTNYPIKTSIANLTSESTKAIAKAKAESEKKAAEQASANKAPTPIIIKTDSGNSQTSTNQNNGQTGLPALANYSQAKGTIGGAGNANVEINFNQYNPQNSYMSASECYPQYPKQIYNLMIYSNNSNSPNSFEFDESYNGASTGTYNVTLNGNTLTGTFTNESTGKSSYVSLKLS